METVHHWRKVEVCRPAPNRKYPNSIQSIESGRTKKFRPTSDYESGMGRVGTQRKIGIFRVPKSFRRAEHIQMESSNRFKMQIRKHFFSRGFHSRIHASSMTELSEVLIRTSKKICPCAISVSQNCVNDFSGTLEKSLSWYLGWGKNAICDEMNLGSQESCEFLNSQDSRIPGFAYFYIGFRLLSAAYVYWLPRLDV